MAQHRMVCTDQEPSYYQPTTHAHIVAVGTGTDPNRAKQRWTLQQVLDAIDRGEIFYTLGVYSGKVALVEKYTCIQCWRTHIRSASDAVTDNNLDNLRRCNWE